MNSLRRLFESSSSGAFGSIAKPVLTIGVTLAASALSVQLTRAQEPARASERFELLLDTSPAARPAAANARIAVPRASELPERRLSIPLPAPDEIKVGRINCTVVQEGGPTDELWYFGGLNAFNYSEIVGLRLTNGRNQPTPPYEWRITKGADKVDFANGRDNAVTTTKRIDLVATAASEGASEPTPDIQIRVTGSNGIACLFDTLVFAPDHLVFLGLRDFPGPDGFFSETTYRSESQFNTTLPNPVELNSDWGDEVSDFAGDNWTWPSELGQFVNPALWCESAERCGPSFSVPDVMSPQTPLLTTKVDHRSGGFRHGSTTTNAGAPNPGVLVRFVKWQIYQDHGRHE